MKKLLLSITAIALLFLSSCSKTVESNELVQRNNQFFLPNSNTPFTGKVIDYFLDGKIKATYNLKDGQYNGIYKTFYENGQQYMVRTFKEGLAQGESKSYFNNGQLAKVLNYKDGALNGEFREYQSPTGKLWVEANYENGVFHGDKIRYNLQNNKPSTLEKYQNGLLAEEISYIYNDNGVFSTAYTIYDGKSKISYSINATNDTTSYASSYLDEFERRHKNGLNFNWNDSYGIKFGGEYVDGNKVGIFNEEFTFGSYKSGEYNTDGFEIGKWSYFGGNKALKITANFGNNVSRSTRSDVIVTTYEPNGDVNTVDTLKHYAGSTLCIAGGRVCLSSDYRR